MIVINAVIIFFNAINVDGIKIYNIGTIKINVYTYAIMECMEIKKLNLVNFVILKNVKNVYIKMIIALNVKTNLNRQYKFNIYICIYY